MDEHSSLELQGVEERLVIDLAPGFGLVEEKPGLWVKAELVSLCHGPVQIPPPGSGVSTPLGAHQARTSPSWSRSRTERPLLESYARISLTTRAGSTPVNLAGRPWRS
jgi:hypothetical protein